MGTGEAEQLRDLLALNVRRLRRDQNISQEALADAAGLDRTYLGSIERSEQNVSLDSLCALAHGLSPEVWCLLSDGKESQSPQ